MNLGLQLHLVHTVISCNSSMVVFKDKSRTAACPPLEKDACYSMFCSKDSSRLLQEVMSQIDRVAQDHKQGSHIRTVFDKILESNLPNVDKEPQRLLDEARMIIFAGTEPLPSLGLECTELLTVGRITLLKSNVQNPDRLSSLEPSRPLSRNYKPSSDANTTPSLRENGTYDFPTHT